MLANAHGDIALKSHREGHSPRPEPLARPPRCLMSDVRCPVEYPPHYPSRVALLGVRSRGRDSHAMRHLGEQAHLGVGRWSPFSFSVPRWQRNRTASALCRHRIKSRVLSLCPIRANGTHDETAAGKRPTNQSWAVCPASGPLSHRMGHGADIGTSLTRTIPAIHDQCSRIELVIRSVDNET